MRKSTRVSTVVLCVAATLSGCGGDKDSTTTTSSTTSVTSSTTTPQSSTTATPTTAAGASTATTASGAAIKTSALDNGTYCGHITGADPAALTVDMTVWTKLSSNGTSPATKLPGTAYRISVKSTATIDDVGVADGGENTAGYLRTISKYGAGTAPTVQIKDGKAVEILGDRGIRPSNAVEHHGCLVSGG